MDNSIIIGGITGFVSQGLTWPMEYLKTTKQLPRYRNSSILNTLIKNVSVMSIEAHTIARAIVNVGKYNNVIDMNDLVELTFKADKVITWQ